MKLRSGRLEWFLCGVLSKPAAYHSFVALKLSFSRDGLVTVILDVRFGCFSCVVGGVL
jgi:hypothetical protein